MCVCRGLAASETLACVHQLAEHLAIVPFVVICVCTEALEDEHVYEAFHEARQKLIDFQRKRSVKSQEQGIKRAYHE
jgi:hypothetical protein